MVEKLEELGKYGREQSRRLGYTEAETTATGTSSYAPPVTGLR
jgi:hypothetical protein